MKPFVLVSGGFDPLHVGHVRLIRAAAERGFVVVALNSDAWLVRKKGFVFMPWAERGEILRSVHGVARVVEVEDSDGTVAQAILTVLPNYFANGGDRGFPNKAEAAACKRVGAEQLFNVGGAKVQSSSRLLAAVPR